MSLPHASLLKAILTQPTAPFREIHVRNALEEGLRRLKVRHFRDPAGNLILGAASLAEVRRLVRSQNPEPLRIFIAHMDHPGFVGTRWLSGGTQPRLAVRWLGGTPTQHLEGARVWLGTADGQVAEGTLRRAKLHRKSPKLETSEVHWQAAGAARADLGIRADQANHADRPARGAKSTLPAATDLFGGFRFKSPLWQEGTRLYTRAADDGVGCYLISALAAAQRGKNTPFLGLLTRGEEVGFVGAVAFFESGILKGARRPVLCVSIETSRQLPSAVIGGGPILRLGDRSGVFSTGYLRSFEARARKAMPGKFQKRVMDGGSCEATAALTYGFPTVGISVPLGNYHNQSLEGGPDAAPRNGPAPEFVDLNDVSGALKLAGLLLKPGLNPESEFVRLKEVLRKECRGFGKLMRWGAMGVTQKR
jgi:endoglucanase